MTGMLTAARPKTCTPGTIESNKDTTMTTKLTIGGVCALAHDALTRKGD